MFLDVDFDSDVDSDIKCGYSGALVGVYIGMFLCFLIGGLQFYTANNSIASLFIVLGTICLLGIIVLHVLKCQKDKKMKNTNVTAA